MRTGVYLLLILLLGLTINSCKKDDDIVTQDNGISWVVRSPAANSSFTIPGTILIDADVTGNQLIESIRIQLRNRDNIKVADELLLKPAATSVSLNELFSIDDESLPSGEYYFSLNAFTQSGNKEVFLQFFIIEAPLELKSTFYVSDNAGLYFTNTDSIIKLTDLSRQPHLAYLYSSQSRSFFLDTLSQNLSSFLLPALNAKWEKDVNDFGSKPRFQINYFNGDELFFPDADGRIHGLNADGQGIFTSNPRPGFEVNGLIKTDQHLIYLEENRFNGQQQLKTTFYPSGQDLDQLLLKQKASFIFRYGDNNAGLIENHKDGSTLKKFLVDEQKFEFQAIDLPFKVRTVVQPSETLLFLIVGNSIYRVDLTTNSTMNLGSTHAANSVLTYEKLSGRIWEIAGRDVYRFDGFQPGQKPVAETYPHNINNFLFLYNR